MLEFGDDMIDELKKHCLLWCEVYFVNDLMRGLNGIVALGRN
jgi:hypothetical protein